MAAFGLAGTLSIAMLLAGMPLVSMGIVAVASASFAIASRLSLAARALRAAALPSPEAIVAIDLREAYRSILASYDEIERGVRAARRLRSVVDPVLGRCMAAVDLCGRMAMLANPLQRHLDAHDPRVLRADLERLRARASAATDEQVARVLQEAIAVRVREIAGVDRIAATRDRIAARLELCRAALGAFSAAIVRLHAAEQEQLLLAAGSLTDHLDGVGDKLEILDAVLTAVPRAPAGRADQPRQPSDAEHLARTR